MGVVLVCAVTSWRLGASFSAIAFQSTLVRVLSTTVQFQSSPVYRPAPRAFSWAAGARARRAAAWFGVQLADAVGDGGGLGRGVQAFIRSSLFVGFRGQVTGR